MLQIKQKVSAGAEGDQFRQWGKLSIKKTGKSFIFIVLAYRIPVGFKVRIEYTFQVF